MEDELCALKSKLKTLHVSLSAGTVEEKLRRQHLEGLDISDALELKKKKDELARRRKEEKEHQKREEEALEESYRNIVKREGEICHKAEVWAEWESSWEETRRREEDPQPRREAEEARARVIAMRAQEEKQNAHAENFRVSLKKDMSEAVAVEYARRCQFLEDERLEIARCKKALLNKTV